MGNALNQQLELTPTIISFHVGKPKEVAHGEKLVSTAIFKHASDASHFISITGVEGDAQGDTVHHGGPDKAICVYLQNSYTYWPKYGRQLEYGAFGENMTISHLKEDEVKIGDVYRIGQLVVQVSQPRQPCFKLGIRNQWPELVKLSRNSGYTGFYLRVLEEGVAAKGMKVEMISAATHSLSIFEANSIMYSKQSTSEQLQKLLAIPELAEAWKTAIHKRLERLQKELEGQ